MDLVTNFTGNDEWADLPFFAASPDCVKLLDWDGRIQCMNGAGMKLLEIDDFKAVNNSLWVEGWPASEQPLVLKALNDVRANRISRFVGKCPTQKGTLKWWDVAVSPILDANNEVIRILAVSRDITAQRIAERQLRQSEQRFRALADNMAQLAWMADGSGKIFWYNRRWYEFTGSDPNEPLGDAWTKYHHPDHVDRVLKKINEHFASGEVWEDLFPLKSASGEYRWFLSRANPIHDDQGNVELWCGTNTDITDQRAAGARLRQLARLIELSHEAILIWDIEDGILLWNEGCEALYGFSRTEALGKSSHQLLHTVNTLPPREFEAYLKSEGEWTGEVLHTAKDGGQVWVDSRQELIRFGDRSVVLETNRDITERRRADHTRDLLVGELNHRVKNTLAIVQSIAGQTARHSTDMRQFLSNFNDRLQTLSSTHNVLTDANWAGANISDLIDFQLANEPRDGRRIRVAGPSVILPAQIALQVSLMLYELASNARAHGSLSNNRGSVIVTWKVHDGSPRKFELEWQESGGPPVATPTKRGFGLTLITRTGNQPNLRSEMSFDAGGVKCRIEADLPEEPKQTHYFNPGKQFEVRRQEPRTVRPAIAQRVLIIEDEPLIALEVEEILSEAGYVALGPVSSVEAALKAISEMRLDFALVDGLLLGERVDVVVAELERRGIPFAFVTGSNRGDLPAGHQRVPLVEKPIGAANLLRTLKTIASSRR